MLKAKIGIILCSIIVCVYSYQFMTQNSDADIYGNDKESIIKSIQLSERGMNQEDIEILKIIDIKNNRIFPYLYNNKPGFIHFTKRISGNYLISDYDNHSDSSLEAYVLDIESDDSNQLLLIVSNEANDKSKLKVTVDNRTIVKALKIGEKNFSISKIPRSKHDSYSFKLID
ncbi:hypothetical protein [Bacillus sp. OAE603]|uniref:hypothetical protein n=1 Tax=Gottfriedia sp. OAE603 TaxID=2663872 RepID=UPI00178BFE85